MSWIEGYEGLYKIYQNGDVESYYKHRKSRILKHCIDKGGYKYVCLSKNTKRKHFKIHRLIAIYFINNPNPDEYLWVDHIDRNKQNNSLENLRWVSISMNNRNQENIGKYLKGVRKTANGKRFKSEISINKKKIYLGTFDTEVEAHQVFMVEYNKIMNLH